MEITDVEIIVHCDNKERVAYRHSSTMNGAFDQLRALANQFQYMEPEMRGSQEISKSTKKIMEYEFDGVTA